VVVLAPLFFMEKAIGAQDPPAITHPMFFYGFAGAGLAWQIAFLAIARNPARLRPMMPVTILEKVSYGLSGVVLYTQHRMKAPFDLGLACFDLLWAVLFMAAYVKTSEAGHRNGRG
jgi:hypothetical protein